MFFHDGLCPMLHVWLNKQTNKKTIKQSNKQTNKQAIYRVNETLNQPYGNLYNTATINLSSMNTYDWQPTRGGPPAWGLGEVLTTPPREKTLLRNIHKARCFLWRQNRGKEAIGETQKQMGGQY